MTRERAKGRPLKAQSTEAECRVGFTRKSDEESVMDSEQRSEAPYVRMRLRRIAEQYEMNVVSIEVDEDHVHIYIEIPPKIAVGRAVGILKSLSARFMFKQYPSLKRKLWKGNLWEASYFARSVGDGVTGDMVQRYIEKHSESAQNYVQAELFPKGATRPKGNTGA